MGKEKINSEVVSRFKILHVKNQPQVMELKPRLMTCYPFRESNFPNREYSLTIAESKDRLGIQVHNVALVDPKRETGKNQYFITNLIIDMDLDGEGNVTGVHKENDGRPRVVVQLHNVNQGDTDNNWRVEYRPVLNHPDIFAIDRVINNNPKNKTRKNNSNDRVLTPEEAEAFIKFSDLNNRTLINPLESAYVLLSKDLSAEMMRHDPLVGAALINE